MLREHKVVMHDVEFVTDLINQMNVSSKEYSVDAVLNILIAREHMRRFACRYNGDVASKRLDTIYSLYGFKKKPAEEKNDTDDMIYKLCVDTMDRIDWYLNSITSVDFYDWTFENIYSFNIFELDYKGEFIQALGKEDKISEKLGEISKDIEEHGLGLPSKKVFMLDAGNMGNFIGQIGVFVGFALSIVCKNDVVKALYDTTSYRMPNLAGYALLGMLAAFMAGLSSVGLCFNGAKYIYNWVKDCNFINNILTDNKDVPIRRKDYVLDLDKKMDCFNILMVESKIGSKDRKASRNDIVNKINEYSLDINGKGVYMDILDYQIGEYMVIMQNIYDRAKHLVDYEELYLDGRIETLELINFMIRTGLMPDVKLSSVVKGLEKSKEDWVDTESNTSGAVYKLNMFRDVLFDITYLKEGE